MNIKLEVNLPTGSNVNIPYMYLLCEKYTFNIITMKFVISKMYCQHYVLFCQAKLQHRWSTYTVISNCDEMHMSYFI